MLSLVVRSTIEPQYYFPCNISCLLTRQFYKINILLHSFKNELVAPMFTNPLQNPKIKNVKNQLFTKFNSIEFYFYFILLK